MKEISSYSGLEAILIGIIQEALEGVRKKVEEQMKLNIDIDVYEANTPNQYDRTYQLKDSVMTTDVKTVKGGGSFYLQHDTSKIKYAPLYQHGSPSKKWGDVSKLIPEIIAFNLSGDWFNDGWWQNRDSYYLDTLEDLQDKGMLSKWFKEELRNRGVEIV